jgi:hypothetical protein
VRRPFYHASAPGSALAAAAPIRTGSLAQSRQSPAEVSAISLLLCSNVLLLCSKSR